MSDACESCDVSGKADFQRFGVDVSDADAVVALAGNPNTGKTTLFNALTGLRMHVGNWPGKTVAQEIGGNYKSSATGETVKTFTAASDAEVDAAITRAANRFVEYRRTDFAQRARWMHAAADLLETEADDVAAMMTLEMGKTLTSAKAEALKCVKGFRYYADHSEELLADEIADASKVNASKAFARYQPLGVVLAVMPWNFPLWQAVRFAAPALMAGNVGLLKHASNVPQTALYLADLLTRAGFPDGCFQTLLISSGAAILGMAWLAIHSSKSQYGFVAMIARSSASIGVSTHPGATALTRMLSRP